VKRARTSPKHQRDSLRSRCASLAPQRRRRRPAAPGPSNAARAHPAGAQVLARAARVAAAPAASTFCPPPSVPARCSESLRAFHARLHAGGAAGRGVTGGRRGGCRWVNDKLLLADLDEDELKDVYTVRPAAGPRRGAWAWGARGAEGAAARAGGLAVVAVGAV
jgi:hypothetical protein